MQEEEVEKEKSSYDLECQSQKNLEENEDL
jgi:hypothetical protein